MRRVGDLLLAIAVCLLDVFFFSTAGSNLAEVGSANLSPIWLIAYAAAGAQRLVSSDPQRAIEALGHVEAAGRQAMSELRRMLALQGADGQTPAQAQQPGLDDLGQLVDGVRRTGVPVEMVVEGEPKQLDPSVGLAAYRAVQEALTNAAKHAGVGAATTVSLMWTDDLMVRVTNALPRQAPATSKALSTGHGLLGLRERVAVVGGRLEAGHSDGGYQVTVNLPVAAR
jgi:signal transduction histidine kinase